MRVIAGKLFEKNEVKNSLMYDTVTGTSKITQMVSPKAYWWKCDFKDVKVGEFAIVENRDSYTMVEVIAVADIDEHNVYLISGRGEISKKVIAKIDRKTLDALSNGEKVDVEVATDKKKAKTTKKKEK